MTKAEVLSQVASVTGVTRKLAGEVYDAILDAWHESLLDGDSIRLDGIGTINVKQRAERMARNPQTQQMIKVPARRTLSLSVSKGIKDKFNEMDSAKTAKKVKAK